MTLMPGREPLIFLNIASSPREEVSDSPDIPQGEVLDDEFLEKVTSACNTLPPTIRALADFPPIEILDEPAHPTPGRETLGRFFGLSRDKKLTFTITGTPTVIHIYRGPVNRYASNRGDRIDEVLRTVVWHEVAHWLGFHTEQEVAELGLQLR
jgi:predicted Zn-dependent protease with MMP-like domain